MNMIPDGAIASGVISKIINDLADVSKSKIKKAVEDKKNKHKSLESQLYNLIVSVLKDLNDNSYDRNSDKIYDTAEKLLKGFIEYGKEDEDAVRYALKNILSCVDDDKCIEFKRLLIHEISKEEYNELYREIRLLQEEKEYKKTDRIERKVDHLDQKLDDIRKNDERIIRNTDKAEKFQNNKKQDYIDNWNSRLFLHIDNDERPLTLADVFIMPDYEYHKKDRRMNLTDIDTMNEVIEKFIKYNRSANMLITGVPGIGKTSIVSWIANKYKENDNVIILRFRDWEKEELGNGMLKAICYTLECVKRDLENKIIILDGFDEIKILDDGENLIRSFLNDILDYKNLKIIVTSRTDYINVYLFQYIFKLLPFQINEIKQFYYMITGNPEISNIDQSNIDVLGIPVILYMAIMSDIDITKKATKPELYGKIFAEKGGIFDKFSYCGIGYDFGNQLLRDSENIKKYLSFLHEIAFKMFDENKLSLPREEEKIPQLVFQGVQISVLEFPIKNLFENTMSNIEFVHKSIYEYFVSDHIYGFINNCLESSIESCASILGKALIKGKWNDLPEEISEFLRYKIENSKLCKKYEKIIDVFRLMLHNGMLFYTKQGYTNIIECEMNIFANMLEIIHLWRKVSYELDSTTRKYFNFNNKSLNLTKVNFTEFDLSNSNLSCANLMGAFLSDANLQKSNLRDANLKKAILRGTILKDANLINVNLSEADLKKANLREAVLKGANLENANLKGANLINADLRRANLCSASLIGADLRGAILKGANLKNVNLIGSIFTEE